MLTDLLRKGAQSISPVRTVAGGAVPYEAGGAGRRARDWNASRLGTNTLLWGNLEQIRARCRDQARNNPWAISAIDRFESNAVGSGIQPHWNIPEYPQAAEKIQKLWARTVRESDWLGQLSFYGQQGLAAREVFEAGEVFGRLHLLSPARKRSGTGYIVPLRLQLLESEQLPHYLNINSTQTGNAVRMGIEFNPNDERVTYHFYREHPGDSAFYPSDALARIQIPADQILHVMKPLRSGQFRGQPALTPVLTLLYELDQCTDAEIVRRKVATMFAGFIKKPTANDRITPPAPFCPTVAPGTEQSVTQNSTPRYMDTGTDEMRMEPGTLQVLFPDEDITFPNVPTAGDIGQFMDIMLHKFAAGIGLTYEQISTNLRGVNYSSIRAGLLEFRRSCEQFQFNILIHQLCNPYACRWLKEAILSGALDLGKRMSNAYYDSPYIFEDIIWVPPGWQWIDPQKEMQAYLTGTRAGFTSRTIVCREQGYDPSVIDAQQAEERARAKKQGLVYDSNPNDVLIGRETNPELLEQVTPDREDAQEEENEGQQDKAASGRLMPWGWRK